MADIYSVEELKSIIHSVARQYGVKKVALFGSYSSGTPSETSDVDLIIDKGNIKGLFMFNSFVRTLEEKLNKPVDVMTYSSLNNSLIKAAVQDEVVLYEQ